MDERPEKSIPLDYPVMKISDIEKLWNDKIKKQIAKDYHLFCWTTQKFLPEAIRLVGFGAFDMCW